MRVAQYQPTMGKMAIKIYDKYKLNQNHNIKKSVQREIMVLSMLSRTVLEQDDEAARGGDGGDWAPGSGVHASPEIKSWENQMTCGTNVEKRSGWSC